MARVRYWCLTALAVLEDDASDRADEVGAFALATPALKSVCFEICSQVRINRPTCSVHPSLVYESCICCGTCVQPPTEIKSLLPLLYFCRTSFKSLRVSGNDRFAVVQSASMINENCFVRLM